MNVCLHENKEHLHLIIVLYIGNHDQTQLLMAYHI